MHGMTGWRVMAVARGLRSGNGRPIRLWETAHEALHARSCLTRESVTLRAMAVC